MSRDIWLRHGLLSAAICGSLLFGSPAFGDHPPLGGIEPQAPAAEPIDAAVITVPTNRFKRFPIPNTTLINDVQTAGEPRYTEWQKAGPCAASPFCENASDTITTGPVVDRPAVGTWLPVTFPQSQNTGPCGTESCLSGDVVFSVAPERTVYGDVLRLFETPVIQQGAVTCSNPHCTVASRTVAVQDCPLCCDRCACTDCDKCGQSIAHSAPGVQAKPEGDLHRGEAAEVILNLIDDVGPSVLKGTLFEDLAGGCLIDHECESAANHQATRELVIQWIRQLEDNDRSPPIKAPPGDVKPQAKYVKIKHADAGDATIHSLRKVARTLEDAAEMLEDQSLYPRADQLREIAQQIRHEARGHAVPTAHRPAPPMFPRPPSPNRSAPISRDLETELEHIRHQLEQVRDALRWQQREAIR